MYRWLRSFQGVAPYPLELQDDDPRLGSTWPSAEASCPAAAAAAEVVASGGGGGCCSGMALVPPLLALLLIRLGAASRISSAHSISHSVMACRVKDNETPVMYVLY